MTAEPLTHSRYPELPGFEKRMRELVYALIDANWTGRRTSKGHWLGKSPTGQTITIPPKGSGRTFQNAKAQVLRAVAASMPEKEREALWAAHEAADDPISQDLITAGLVKKQTQRIIDQQIADAAAEQEAAIQPVVRPWKARKQPTKAGGQVYESHAVLEREHADGSIDYLCAFNGCEWASDKPQSVARHYAGHTKRGETQAAAQGPMEPTTGYTEPLTHREYRPTQRLVEALADFMESTTMIGSWDSEALATAILTWFHERPDIDHESRELVPLTERQILDRIRMLVGQPDQSEEIEALKAENLALANEITRMQNERRALIELLSEEE